MDGTWQSIVACDVTAETNDKQQAAPMAHATLETLAQAGMERPRDVSGAPKPLPATLDNGYDSAGAVEALEALGGDPYIAPARLRHHVESAEGPEATRTAKERMAAKGLTPEGRALYGERKAIVAPVFGQSKEGRGVRRFLLRGMQKRRGAWRLVCLTHNLLKLWRYGCVASPTEAGQEVRLCGGDGPVHGVRPPAA